MSRPSNVTPVAEPGVTSQVLVRPGPARKGQNFDKSSGNAGQRVTVGKNTARSLGVDALLLLGIPAAGVAADVSWVTPGVDGQ